MNGMPCSRLRLCLLAIAALLSSTLFAASVPLRGDLPPGANAAEPLPFCGGVPFARGALKSADNVRLLGADGKEVPCQVASTAVWPDGSVKWVLVDAVLTPEAAKALTLEYGPDVRRASVADALKAELAGTDARISGGGVSAAVHKVSPGVLDECSLGGKPLVAPGKPALLIVNTLRIAEGTSDKVLPVHTFVCRDTTATLDIGKLQIDEIAVESSGPVRATVRLRGFVLLPRFGSTLPDAVKKREPPGRLPFSLRWSFYRQCPVVYGQHQIVFSGEPDCDYIARWGLELPGRAGPRGCLVLEPGVELDVAGEKLAVAKEQDRLCWAPLKDGLALVRQGWENRPCAVTMEDGAASLDFWPRAAGVWDLRRYARDWAVGESGDTKKPEVMLHYAKFAARGIAKSHNFILSAAGGEAATPALARALSGRALLVAPPAWYASTVALGPLVPEQASGDLAPLDATTRRRADYYLYSQDLFRWHGKLTYGFWQTRFGEMHRTDRWEVDYGRWAWGLNDGAGRVGHVLMLQFLRTLERRYFDAGEAFNRINYDTNMVHTEQHLENAADWWTAKGCCHRHNVQPFGCPYVGMRGSYPVGQRILHLLTGDGVIADGLDIVADTSFQYANGAGARLCNSGGSDGQGSASNALLWRYETTGDVKYLDACRKVLDKSELVPPRAAKDLGYGPSFGLFNAAGEYAELSGDAAFQQRVIELARLGAKEKDPSPFLYAIAMGARFAKDEGLREKLAAILKSMAAKPGKSLAELPPDQWPGHAGFRTAEFDANAIRDIPCALAVVAKPEPGPSWPKLTPNTKPLPAQPPADWFAPGGDQKSDEKVPAADELLAAPAGTGGGTLTAGPVTWTAKETLCDTAAAGGAAPLASGIVPFVALMSPKDDDPRLAAKFEIHQGKVENAGPSATGALLAAGKAGPVPFTARLRVTNVDHVPSIRVELACKPPAGAGRVASWGLLIPLKLSANGNAIQTTAPGRFRLERCRLDQNDEKLPNWLTSEYNWPDGTVLWPKWRESGISVGPGRFYRIWRANRTDVSPVFCDQGEGAAAWFDLTDRGSNPRWGVTIRVLRPAGAAMDTSRQAVRAKLETGLLEVQFHDVSAEPLAESAAAAGLSGAADVIFHDGWRPPLSPPELTAAQYEKFLDDLDYGGNYGLFALRFCLSLTHQVSGRKWVEKIRDLGIEPREILYGMQFGDGLARHCAKLGVKWDATDVEGSVRRVVEHYRK